MLATAVEFETIFHAGREDRALLESTPSASSGAGGRTRAFASKSRAPSCPSIGQKATNSRPKGVARRAAQNPVNRRPVGHMSTSPGLFVWRIGFRWFPAVTTGYALPALRA